MADISSVVPFRDRHEHLRIFLQHMQQFAPQEVEYIVVEQSAGLKFNRGLLLNVGFNVSHRERVIFHDVDLVPDSQLLQQYTQAWPRPVMHFGCRFGRYNNTKTYFGGVVGFCRHAFPGFSNRYFGWGGEDDSLRRRCRHAVGRPTTGAYTDLEFLPHVHQKLDRLDHCTKCTDKWEVRDSECYADDNHHTTNVNFIEVKYDTYACRWVHVQL